MDLSLERINQWFGKTQALNNINLLVRQGEFVAILGPSGCGKSTLLRIIGGFLEPTSGVVRLGDTVYSGNGTMVPVEERDLGMVFQSFALWPHMTVRQHVEFPLKSRRQRAMSAAEKKAAVDRTLDAMGLTALADRYPGELSGGQRQRVSLARMMVGLPSLMLMDEPLSALDAELKLSMRQVIQDVHRSTGSTILYVTHDQSEALAMADVIIVMKDGHIEQIGTPREIYLHPRTKFVAQFVSRSNLIPGEWKDGQFHVANTNLVYPDADLPYVFKHDQCFPIRPEQFKISRTEPGLPAVVTNRQYNGRWISYHLLQGNQQVEVVTGPGELYQPGEQVRLVYYAQERGM